MMVNKAENFSEWNLEEKYFLRAAISGVGWNVVTNTKTDSRRCLKMFFKNTRENWNTKDESIPIGIRVVVKVT